MKNREKLIVSAIVGWTIIHIILYQSIGHNGCIKQYHGLFWPIDEGALKCLYDVTEFLTYVLPPIIMYIVYKLLGGIKTLSDD